MILRVALFAVGCHGCSFVFVDGPPRRHAEMPYFACSESRVVPILDTVFTAVQALNLLGAASMSDARWNDTYDGEPPFSRGAAVAVYAAFAVLGTGGMYYGYNAVSECRRARDDLHFRLYGPLQPNAPPPPGNGP